MGNDSAYPLLRSPHRKSTSTDNPADALAISMQEVGRVEVELIYFDFQKQGYQIAKSRYYDEKTDSTHDDYIEAQKIILS